MTCPDIADGNPWAMHALSGLAEAAGLTHEMVLLQRGSSMVKATHGIMTAVPRLAEWYSAHSEAQRSGLAANAYARLSFLEVAEHMDGIQDDGPIHWVATQEHALRGADAETLDRLGVDRISLVVPDSFPKQSAVDAVRAHDRATMYVWNVDAFNELIDQDIDVKLIKPFLIEGIIGKPELSASGHTVVAKTSGSGMPRRWVSQLVQQLSRVSHGRLMSGYAFDWSLYTPNERYGVGQCDPMPDRLTRLGSLCSEIGLSTCLIIGFPTELTGVVAEASQKGALVKFLANPPRGQHEVDNLEFLQRHGLLAGEIDFTGKHKPSLPGVLRVPVQEVSDLVSELSPNDEAEYMSVDSSVVGTQEFLVEASLV